MEIAHYTTSQFVEFMLVQIIAGIQLALIIISIIQFRRFNESTPDGEERMNPDIYRWYFIVLISGMFVFIFCEWYSISGDLNISFIHYDPYCIIGVILLNIAVITYFSSVYMFYLYRIYVTFKGSQFAVSDITFRVITSITIVVYISSIVGVTVIHLLESEHNHGYMGEVRAFCAGNLKVPIHVTLRVFFQIMIVICNIFYGFFFYDQMKRFLFFTKNCTGLVRKKKMQLKTLLKLIQKQSTLVFVSTLSTMILWTGSNILVYLKERSFVQIWIYFDILINCVCIWSMFKFNNGFYLRYCNVCAFFNDHSVMIFSYTETMNEINRYPTDAINPSIRKIRIKNKVDDYDQYDSDYVLMEDSKENTMQTPTPETYIDDVNL